LHDLCAIAVALSGVKRSVLHDPVVPGVDLGYRIHRDLFQPFINVVQDWAERLEGKENPEPIVPYSG